jgi:hypothetical protein
MIDMPTTIRYAARRFRMERLAVPILGMTHLDNAGVCESSERFPVGIKIWLGEKGLSGFCDGHHMDSP